MKFVLKMSSLENLIIERSHQISKNDCIGCICNALSQYEHECIMYPDIFREKAIKELHEEGIISKQLFEKIYHGN